MTEMRHEAPAAQRMRADGTYDPTPVHHDGPEGEFAVEGIGRWFLLGSLIGGLGVFVFGAGITLLATHSVGGAIGVGAFSGVFGGPGFGGTLGAAIDVSHDHYAADRHRTRD